ncbi:MAG: NAD(P)/FAD-dependent oxidoreductase [Flavobacteriales bacterium]
MYSFWDRETFLQKADYLIVGGGLVGMWTAYFLKKQDKGLKIIILERGALPSGASTRNAGFACFGSVTELNDDLTRMSENEVFSLVHKRYEGLLKLRELLGDKEIGYEPLGGFEVFDDVLEYEKHTALIDSYNKKLFSVTGVNTYVINAKKATESGFKTIKGVIENTCEGQLHTGKMAARLMDLCKSLGVVFLNGAEVTEWADSGSEVHLLINSIGEMKSKKVLFATNGFATKLLPQLEVKPARAQVIVTKPVKGLKLNGSFHYEKGYYYFRNINDRILIGGGRNLDFEGETTSLDGLTPIIQQRLEELLYNVVCPYEKPEIDIRWSGTMGVGPVKYPIIEKVSENAWCAVRLGGMGVALGTVVGEEVASLMKN